MGIEDIPSNYDEDDAFDDANDEDDQGLEDEVDEGTSLR